MTDRHRGNGYNRSLHGRVYQRDRWTCQMPECLCPDGRTLNPDLRGVDGPWMPTIDHIVPLTDGGSDGLRNMRAAHKLCNLTGRVSVNELICAYCGEPFTPTSDEQLYCRKVHKVRAERKRRRDRYKVGKGYIVNGREAGDGAQSPPTASNLEPASLHAP